MKPSTLGMSGRIKPLRALVEVTLIALGVLAGLSAEAWLNSRGERQLEREYLLALEKEMEENLTWLSGRIERTEQIVGSGEAMIRRYLEEASEPSVSLREFLSLFYFSTFNPVTATVDQLVASGDLSVIRSGPLRLNLARWASSADARADFMNHEQWENWTHGTLPFLRKDKLGIVGYAVYSGEELAGLVQDETIGVSDEVAMVIAERLIVARDLLLSANQLKSLAEEISEELAELR